MTRLVVFVTFLALLFAAMSLRFFQGKKPDSKPFSFSEYQKAFEDKTEAVQKYKTEAYFAHHPDEAPAKVEGESAEAAAPVVELVLDTEESKRGAQIFQSKCVVCHGKNAEGKKGQNAPKLAGQYEWYTVKQLNDMKAQRRVNKVMDPYLKPLNEGDFKDLAAYLAKYKW